METRELYNYKSDSNVFWFTKKNGKWVGMKYDRYEYPLGTCIAFALLADDVQYTQVDVEDPYDIVGSDPIYDETGNVIYQLDHKRTPLDDFIDNSYELNMVLCDELPNADNARSWRDKVFITLPMEADNDGFYDAYIIFANSGTWSRKYYAIKCNPNTKQLKERENNGAV